MAAYLSNFEYDAHHGEIFGAASLKEHELLHFHQPDYTSCDPSDDPQPAIPIDKKQMNAHSSTDPSGDPNESNNKSCSFVQILQLHIY
jgi:hypothetical protein